MLGAIQQSRESPREFIVRSLLNPTLVLSIYGLAAVIATLVKLAPGAFEQNGFHYEPLQNFAIFRNSFFDLIHGQDLYARFDAEQWDFYRYSPTFALLFAPFAVMPYGFGVVLWNLLNALALFWAIRSLPIGAPRTKTLILWFVFLSMLNSISNAQSNALMAGLMLGAWNAQERKNTALSSFLIALSVFVKLFGVFALVPCLLCQGRKKLLAGAACWGAIMAALPLIAVPRAHLLALYRGWYATVRAFSEARLGLSVMGFLRAWFHLDIPQNCVVLAGALILIAIAFRGPHLDPRFRLLVAASVLIFVTIFNYAAESPTFVLAVTGCPPLVFLPGAHPGQSRAADRRFPVGLSLVHRSDPARPAPRVPRHLRHQGGPLHSGVDQTPIRPAALPGGTIMQKPGQSTRFASQHCCLLRFDESDGLS